MAVGRYPSAVWRPGPINKSGYWDVPVNSCEGVVCHSAEGPESAMYVVLDTYAVSWHFSIMVDGRVYQHYDIDKVCYHAGNKLANGKFIGIEHEGKRGTLLTEAQVEASVRLCRWLSFTCDFPMVRGEGLYEHKEVVQIAEPNAGPTSCPSFRIPWARYIPEVQEPAMDDVTTRRALALNSSLKIVLLGGDIRDLAQEEKDVLTLLAEAANRPY